MTVTTDPTNVLPGGAEGGSWLVQNTGSVAVYVGRNAAGASSTTGIRLGAGQAMDVALGTVAGSGVWVSAETGTSTVRVLRSR